ncbi:acyltransferase [Mucilaginibacter sp. JRF]|uniref:acyltransferase family protein n=1 Tax=Mucilaginibacter sp. JRF TaxID=2780088 RepID=UPI00187DE110|nr:acyltransferase family protein [Mucilaginibacter sp. JRF]MBE9585995.1 acyltransferase [Mucilaginibacter sp. JRF]
MSQVTEAAKKFRYDINILRAIAIIGVLLFHYKVKGFNGGFAGVDIFFVISGYLMTKIIVGGISKDNFSLRDFYGKRLKRIIPPLIVMIFILSSICAFFYFPSDYRVLQKNAAASLAFVSNVLYWQTSDYFAKASDDNVLLHTWSLSAEWQFYMVYPLFFIFLTKIRKTKSGYFLPTALLTLLSLVTMLLIGKQDSTSAFYLLHCRAWEMLFGGLAYFSERCFNNFKYRKALAVCGYGVNFGCLFVISTKMTWPGIFTLIPVVATYMIIVCNENDWKLLHNPVAQFIGKTSYSIYLWHWPIYVIAGYIGLELKNLTVILGMVGATLLMGYLSYQFVESYKKLASKTILWAIATLAVVLICCSNYSINQSLFKAGTLKIRSYSETHLKQRQQQFKGTGCFIDSKDNSFNQSNCLRLRPKMKNILLIGDSHAAHFSQSLREVFAKMNINLLQATASGCLPIVRPNGESRCKIIMSEVYEHFVALKSDKIDGVIISANWINNGNDKARLLKDLNATVDYFRHHHIKSIIIGQNELYELSYPLIAAKEYEYGHALAGRYLNKRAAQLNDYLKPKFHNYINVYKIIDGVLPGNVPYMFDRNHYSKPAADMIVNKILHSSIGADFISDNNKN